jgi:hypothetical protein
MPSPFEAAKNSAKSIPVPYWAKKVGRAVEVLFNPTADDPRHPVPVVKDSNSLTETVVVDSNFASIPNLWKTHQTRKAVYSDIERMDGEDEAVATALDIIADCSVSYNEPTDSPQFEINSQDAQVQEILRALSARLDLPNEIWQIARDCVKHGNEFREVVIDRQAMKVIAFKQTISFQIYPKTTERGDKLPGWVVLKDGDIYTNQKGKELDEWQICPFQFGSKRGFLSVPPLASARRNWIRLTKMEDGMAIARLVRAYDKMVHKIPVKPEMSREEVMSRIRMYKEGISKKRMLDSEGMLTQLDSPLDVQSDFYLPDTGDGRGGVELLSANNAQLGNLNDIIYHREKLLTRLQVPIAYLQLTSAQKTHLTAGANKSDVELQFARMLRRVQRMLKKGLRRLCDIELMLHGIVPSEDLYDIVLTPINTKDLREDANIELTYAQAAVYFIEAFGALPPELLASKFMHLDTEQTEILKTFLDEYGKKLTEAKVKTIENGAIPKTDLIKDRLPGDSEKGKGSGNQNKTRGSRSSEQKGSKEAKQSIPAETLVELFYDLQESVFQEMRDNGVEVPEMDEFSQKNAIRANLAQVAQRPDAELIIE